MRGSIIKRGKDSYTVVLSLGIYPATGKYKQQWLSVKGTKKDAEKKLSDMLHQLDTGTFMKPGKTTMSEYLNIWLSDYAKPKLSPRGFERYSGIIRKYLIPEMGSVILTQLKPEHLQKHYTSMFNAGLKPNTVKYHHAVIHKALQTAVKWGLANRNVADDVDVPRIHGNDMQTWDETEIAQFLEAAKISPYYELFYVALFTGMRRGELLALRWQDIDFLFAQISVKRTLHQLKDGSYIFTPPKSEKSRRTIALSPSVILMLKKYKEKQTALISNLGISLNENDLIFSNLEGKPLRPNTITRAWSMLAARAGVKIIRLHDARHTHASLLLKQGVHPKIVQERLGHASIQMTLDTYSHVAPGLQQIAAEGFDRLLNINQENNAIENHY